MVMDAEGKLSQYHAEVLSQGVEALLPQHLPDRWLDHLLAEGNAYLDQQESVSMSTLLLTVLALVDYQQEGASASSGVITLSLQELNNYLTVYVLSLGIEKVSRRTDISGEAPTLETIFDGNRVVRFSRTDRRPGRAQSDGLTWEHPRPSTVPLWGPDRKRGSDAPGSDVESGQPGRVKSSRTRN